MDILELCRSMNERQASDLFITVGKRPAMRILGTIQEAADDPVGTPDVLRFFAEHMPPGLAERLEHDRDMDIGISISDTDRFRLNLSYQKGLLAIAIRRVPSGALTFPELGIPAVIRTLAEQPRGLVLITGATGSGKSTTMAAMLHHINTTCQRHIVTIEDPIEFVHRDVRSLVSQREVGTDTLSFAEALRHVVRQNPDAIFIGEMRDLETIRTAISAAMTGHLVVSTMHTMDAAQTVERIINYFPDFQRDQMAQDLAMALCGIVSQRLLTRKDAQGRVPVFEVLLGTPLARRIIARRELNELEDIIKAGAAEGMELFTRALVRRYEEGAITLEAGAAAATNRDEFLLAVQGMETGIDTLRRREIGVDTPEVTMKKLLRNAVKHHSSDLILTVGSAPLLRIGGQMHELEMARLSATDTQKLLFSILSPSQRAQFEAEKEIDFALSVTERFGEENKDIGESRFRVNGFYQKGCVACALRLIPQQIPDPTTLMIPPVVLDLAKRRQGLVLVTGPTGHGKSTTLACLIDEINSNRSCHIVTIEDPIELVHVSRKAVIEQREVHADTKSFENALKYVLRQAPDVILIGEMRDRETISAALTAAETGHLVLATLHTNDAAQTVDRIIDTFPGDRQNQIRSQLAACIEAVVSQRLLPRLNDDLKRVAAFEVMLGSTAVRALIRDKRSHQLLATIETSAKDGMSTMDKALISLYNRNLITRETFKANARNPDAI